MNDVEKTKTIISENLYMTIAVASQQGDPWISNIYFACDSDIIFTGTLQKTQAILARYVKIPKLLYQFLIQPL